MEIRNAEDEKKKKVTRSTREIKRIRNKEEEKI
jgi:hypothetical protein